jgi:hypothetical protein
VTFLMGNCLQNGLINDSVRPPLFTSFGGFSRTLIC